MRLRAEEIDERWSQLKDCCERYAWTTTPALEISRPMGYKLLGFPIGDRERQNNGRPQEKDFQGPQGRAARDPCRRALRA